MAPKNGFTYNGVNYVSWWHDEYKASANATASMDALQVTEANWASVLTTWYWDPNSDHISADPQKTPADDSVGYAIDELHTRGLQVMLKPHLDGPAGTWRGSMQPAAANMDRWFGEYKDFILHYADIAKRHGAEGLILGTELKMLSSGNLPAWSEIIDAVRANYTGVLTYAANANSIDDEFSQVVFWDQLDLIGLDGYFPLTTTDHPTVDQLVAAWTNNSNHQNLVQAAQQIQTTHQKPVIFTEVGYRSVDGCNIAPWDWNKPGAYNPQDQANCYEAFLQVWSQHADWMQGAFWWDWPVAAPVNNASEYTPQGKPAGDVLKNWFKAGY